MKIFPQLSTERLTLGKIQIQDIPKIVEYAGNINIAKNTLNIPHPYEEKDAIFWINNINQGFESKSQYTFGLRLKSTGAFIGGMGLIINQRFNRAELGYWIAEPFWRKGYATEALSAVLDFGFKQLELNKIFAFHLIENLASGKVMLKNGMVKEGELIEHFKKDGVYQNVIQCRMTRSEFESKQNK